MEPGKSYHMCVDIEATWKAWGRFTTSNGRPVTAYEFEEYRAACRAKGYVCFPPCDNVLPDGRCAGHPLNTPGTALHSSAVTTVLALPDTGAIFSEDRSRRFWLGRHVSDDGEGRLLIVGLNPSIAGEETNDPTIGKEIKFARRWGFRYLDKCNVFDLVSTDPRGLKKTAEPVSAENERYILAAATRARFVLCAWGKHASLLARGARTKRMLLEAGATLKVLKLNGDGSPTHPLYQPDDSEPVDWA